MVVIAELGSKHSGHSLFHATSADRATVNAITEPWVSVEVVAEHLGVAKDSVYRWIEARRLPAHRIGRLWKFKLSEVDGWVRAGGAIQPDDEPPRGDG